MDIFQKIFLLFLSNLYFSFAGYQNYKLQSYEICQKKTFKKAYDTARQLVGLDPEIVLGRGRNSATVIHQVWNSSTVGLFNMNCKFRAKTFDKQMRIYSVITKLNLRRNPDDSCRDWIEFSEVNGAPGRKICDFIGFGGPKDKLIFHDNNAVIKIHVKITDKYVLSDEDQLELKLVLTTHTHCDADYNFKCDPEDPFSCISKEFVNDLVPNCMNNCSDEDSCFSNDSVKRESAEMVEYSHIAVSAIISLIFTMFGVGTIIYICWKYWHVFGRPPENGENANVPTIEMPQTPFNGNIIIEEQQRPPSPKDLPPSYESLFPES